MLPKVACYLAHQNSIKCGGGGGEILSLFLSLTNEYYLFLSSDATKLVSNKCLAIGKIFMAKLVTIATAELVDFTF